MTFEEFYTAFRPAVQRVMRTSIRGLSQDQEEDLTQETFIHAWKAWERVDQSHLSAWVGRIARNVAIDHLRSLQRQKRYLSVWDEEAACQLPDQRTPTWIYSGETELVARAWGQLSPAHQRVLALAFLGYSRRAIAKRVGTDYNTCCKRLVLARARFQTRYRASCEGGGQV